MALHFSLEQIARLRDDTRQLVAHAADAETDLNALLMQSQNDSPATKRALRSLCVLARQHHVALGRLAIDLGDRHVPAPSERPRPRAVLVVDDYPDSREWLSFLLQNAGFVVRTASNGLEAVLAAHQLQPTVIVMDLTMPVLDGMEATRLIKAIDQLRDVKVIAYTARPPDQQPAAEGLFAAILSKPAPPDEILATVQRYALPLV